MNFNASDTHVSHRLHLNESDSNNLQELRDEFYDEFKKISIYPDPGNSNIKDKIATHYYTNTDNLVLGNGVDEIILFLCLTFLKNKRKILTCESTFPGYETSAKVAGGAVIHTKLSSDMKSCINSFIKNVNEDISMAFLCNPHNPTGTVLAKDEVIYFIKEMNKRNVIPVIDEAYIQFSNEDDNSVLNYVVSGGNAIVLRTFSKAYGLAGLRVGFALGPKTLIAEIEKTALALPFRINRFAQKMVPLVLLRNDILESNVKQTQYLIKYIQSSFQESGVQYLPSSTNFICFKPPKGNDDFLNMASELGVMVRDCRPFGLAGWIRASISNTQDAELILSLVKDNLDYNPECRER